MKKLVVSILLALMVAVGVAAPGQALAGDGWAVDFDATMNSKYVWRGMLITDDWVIQPSVNVAKGGFSFNWWGNFEPTDETGHQKQFTEMDLTAQYAFSVDKFSIPVGVIHYAFPNTDANATTELFAGVSYDWIITPSITVYHDIQEAHGIYVQGAASYSLDLPSPAKGVSWGLDLGAGIGYATSDYNSFYFGVDQGAWTDWYASLAVPFSFMDGRLSVSPHVTYTSLVDSQIKDTTENDSNTYFGVSVTLSF